MQANDEDGAKITGLAVRDANGRLKRVLSSAVSGNTSRWRVFCSQVKSLTDEQKKAIEGATSSSDLDVQVGKTTTQSKYNVFVLVARSDVACTVH